MYKSLVIWLYIILEGRRSGRGDVGRDSGGITSGCGCEGATRVVWVGGWR